MPDLTPPPMSDAIAWEIWCKVHEASYGQGWEAISGVFARAIEAHVNEQWRRRLELVGTTDLDGNLLTLKALPDGTPLYRIKEQG